MASRVTSPVIVGRRQELAALEAGVQRAAAGASTTILVGGEAGIGKTRLLDEAVAEARTSGAIVLRGTCVRLGEDGLPLAPIAEALRGLRRSLGPDGMRELIDARTMELANLMPELGSATDELQSTRPDWAQTRVFEAILDLLARLGERAPVVMAFEDLHWADRSTLDVIGFLSRSFTTERVLLVATYRSDELSRRHPLRPWLAEMDRSVRVTRLELGRLDIEELAAQVEGILGRTPDGEVLVSIARRSGGNPFFAEELLAAGAADASGAADQLPETLRDLLLVRVHALDEGTQHVLGCAAVAGPTFEHDLLVGPCHVDETTVSTALRDAVAAQLVVADASSATYGFRHALLQEAIYDELLPRDRRDYHARYAAALGERPVPDGALGASQLAARAHHASMAHDLPLALTSWLDAARASLRVYALAEAADAYERALELWDVVPDDQRPGVDLLDVLFDASLALIGAGRVRRAREIAELAVERAVTTDDPLRAAIVRERYGRALWLDGDLTGALRELEVAVELVRGRPTTVESARVMATFAGLLVLRDHNARAIEVGEEALAQARAIGARQVEAHALCGVGVARVNQGDCATGLAMLHESLRLAGEVQLTTIDHHRIYANLSACLESCGDVEASVDVALDGVEWARQRGLWRQQGAFLESNAASALIELGRWNEARALLERRVGPITEGVARINFALVAGLLAVRTGHLERARAILLPAYEQIRGFNDAQFTGPIYGALVELTLAEERPDDAIALGAEGIEQMRGSEEVGTRYRLELLWLLLHAATRSITDARGRRDAAREATVRTEAERWIAMARATAVEPTGPTGGYGAESRGFALMAEAESLSIAGGSSAAAWAEAGDHWAAMRRPWPVAICRASGAEALLASRRTRADAVTPLREARAIALDLGAEPLVRWCDTLARLARLRLDEPIVDDAEAVAAAPVAGEDGTPSPDSDGAEARRDAYGLTAREGEVLRLLVLGYSNRAIGETLFVSESTAGVHVSNILGKLDASGRVEAAAIAVRAGLVD